MSPGIARPGELATDPPVGSIEWEQLRRKHDEAVARVAKLRQLQGRLPQEIQEAEHTANDLAAQLGLEVPTVLTRRKQPPYGSGGRAVIAALPGTVAEVARRVGVEPDVARARLVYLQRQGRVVRGDGKPAVWSVAPDGGPA